MSNDNKTITKTNKNNDINIMKEINYIFECKLLQKQPFLYLLTLPKKSRGGIFGMEKRECARFVIQEKLL